MGQRATATCEGRLEAYIDGLASVIGHADRVQPLHDYCVGLMLPLERKSVEPMAAKTAPARTSAKHQSLLHFVGQGQWSDEKLLAKVRELVLPGIERHGAIRAWVFDDTSFPKQGRHSVGVARQYSGQLGKQDNCQVVVSLSLANDYASLPVAHRLYLPQEWIGDAARRAKAGVPRGHRLQDQAADRARFDPMGVRGGTAARRWAAGCRLRGRCDIAHGAERARPRLRGGRSVEHAGVEARHTA